MWDLVAFFWRPTLVVLISVLFVNFFIPIRTRLDHSLATALSSGVVWGAWGLVPPAEDLILVRVLGIVIVVFVADFISTFISFTNRIRNAIVTTIVFAPVYLGLILGFTLLMAPFVYLGPR
jgi:hypothetical protein